MRVGSTSKSLTWAIVKSWSFTMKRAACLRLKPVYLDGLRYRLSPVRSKSVDLSQLSQHMPRH